MRVLDVVGPTAVAALGKTLPAVLRLSPLLGPVRPPKWVDRSLHLTVRERSVVAADQDVVALSSARTTVGSYHDGGRARTWM